MENDLYIELHAATVFSRFLTEQQRLTWAIKLEKSMYENADAIKHQRFKDTYLVRYSTKKEYYERLKEDQKCTMII